MWRPEGFSFSLCLTCVTLANLLFTLQIGWALVISEKHNLDASVTIREVAEANRSTTREPTLAKVKLEMRSRPLPWLRLTGKLTALHGGPTKLARSGGLYRWREPFQNLSPAIDLEEMYAEASFGLADFRIGKQRISWGKLDRFAPTDVVNAFSYIDPFLVEEHERRIGSPALHTVFSVPPVTHWITEQRLTLIWVPMFLPFRFADARCERHGTQGSRCEVERWFPPAAVPPTVFWLPPGLVALPTGQPSPAMAIPVTFRLQNLPPVATLRNSSYGARFDVHAFGFDSAFSYFHGFDNQPAFSLRAWASGLPDPGTPLGLRDLAAATTLAPAYRSVDLFGWDIARSFAAFTIRVEAAYVSGRPFARDLRGLVADPTTLRPELLRALSGLLRGAGTVPVSLPDSALPRNAIEWGLGVDVLRGGWTIVFQLNQTDVLNNDAPLLIEDVETRGLVSVKRAWWSSRIQLSVLGGQGFESGYSYLRSRVQYRWTDWLVTEVGGLWIGGSRYSTIGQFRRNDQAWIAATMEF